MTPERLAWWQKAAHEYAVQGGWYDGVDPKDPAFIASRLERIHSEISEAGDCVANGKTSLYFRKTTEEEIYSSPSDRDLVSWVGEGFKPEGFPIELADVFLRLCDFAESIGLDFDASPDRDVTVVSGLMNPFQPREISACLGALHARVAEISLRLEDYGNTNCLSRRDLASTMCQLCELADATGVDLDAMATLKYEYNLTRPRMHGKAI